MNSEEKDYYQILGVIDSAEIAVIKAAYKALMMIYHPDRFLGNKEYAMSKSKKLNEAYAVLSNPGKRRKYDELRFSTKDQYEPEQEVDQEDIIITKSKNDLLEADWNIVIDHFNGVVTLYSNLYQLSPKVAFTYKLYLIESKKFNQAKKIAQKCETDFLVKFFGSNRKIQKFAKWLLKNGHRNIAVDLNRTVNVLGKNLNSKKVIISLLKEYNIEAYKYFRIDIGVILFFSFFFLIILISIYEKYST
jgi:hypothetical protein